MVTPCQASQTAERLMGFVRTLVTQPGGFDWMELRGAWTGTRGHLLYRGWSDLDYHITRAQLPEFAFRTIKAQARARFIPDWVKFSKRKRKGSSWFMSIFSYLASLCRCSMSLKRVATQRSVVFCGFHSVAMEYYFYRSGIDEWYNYQPPAPHVFRVL